MDGRRFIELARRSLALRREENWRDAVCRAYYGLMLECRDAMHRWGLAWPKGDIHRTVRLRFDSPSFADLTVIGRSLDKLSQWRNKADYELSSALFGTDVVAVNTVGFAEQALLDLDSLNADPAMRAAAIADVKSRFP
jgi:hypothetical protein